MNGTRIPQQSQPWRNKDRKWAEKNNKRAAEILHKEKQWKQFDEWYNDFGGPPLPGSCSDCVDNTKDNSCAHCVDNTKVSDNKCIEPASKGTKHTPFSYPLLEGIDDDDNDGTAEMCASRSNPAPVTPLVLPLQQEAPPPKHMDLQSYRNSIRGLKAMLAHKRNAQTGAKRTPPPGTPRIAQPTRLTWGSTLPRARSGEIHYPSLSKLGVTHPAEAPPKHKGPCPS